MDEPESPVLRGSLRLITLGDASVQRVPPAGGEPEEILSPGKPFAVLVYLASAPGRSATRDHLVDLLWANLELDPARHALRQALWYLRKRLGRSAIRSEDEELVLSVPIESDREAFLRAIEAEELERAVERYGGEFLPVFAAPGGAEFEKWADTERYRLRKHFLRAAHSLVRERLSRGAYEEASELAARARDADPLNQTSWRLLLEVLLAAGERVRAQIEARALEEKLDELGRSPEPALRRLLEAARSGRSRPGGDRPREGLEPELIGRGREFAAILSAWSETRGGRGRHVHVEGAAGLGKSRLLADLGNRLDTMGAATVRLRAHPGERDVAYALASKLAGELADRPGGDEISEGAARVLVALNPDLTERYPDAADGESSGEGPLRRRGLALRALMEAVTARGPVAVLIDDLHWADEESRRVLVSLLASAAEQSALVVTTARTEAGAGRISLEHTERLSLEPLGEEEVRRLVASLGATPREGWPFDLPGRLHASTGGSPLLALETLRLALSEGWLELRDGAWTCRDAGGLERELAGGSALRRRVGGLPDRARRILLLLCVAGRPLHAPLLAEAAGEEAGSVARVLGRLEVDGLAALVGEAWTVAHDEIAAVAVEAADRGEVREAHRAVGRCLLRAGEGDPERLRRAARHLREAGDGTGLQRVFGRWTAAARGRGDRRTARRMAADLLGSEPDADDVGSLVDGLSFGTRLTLLPLRRVAAAAALLLAVGAAAAGTALKGGGASPADATLYVLRPASEGRVTGHEVPVAREEVRERATLDLEGAGRPVPQLTELDTRHPVHARPGREQWAVVETVPDSGGWEAYLVTDDGSARRLTTAAGDDVPMGWSPDGRYLLLETSRWNRYGWQDLGALDPETGELRRLTGASGGGQGASHDGAWSPDGTRIAYRRERHGSDSEDPPSLLCWTSVDGTRGECFASPGRSARLVGWEGPEALLALVTDSGDAPALERIDLATKATETVDGSARQAVASPGGRWVATLRAVAGQSARWHVFPADGPGRSVELSGGSGLPRGLFSWSDPRANEGYLDSVAVSTPDTVTRGVPVQLLADGFAADGGPAAIPILTWSSASPGRAAVDPETGVLRPFRTGPISVVASAGGWRSDTARLIVREPSSETALTEDWSGPLEPDWVPFGDPRPTLSRHPELGRVFWARGDGLFYSGAYSERRLRASSGLGLTAAVSTPRTAPAEQELNLSLQAWLDPGAVETWDHSTGGIPGSESTCRVRFPGGDGLYTSSQLSTAGGLVEVGRDLGSGEAYRLTLQLFPDGTCGVAVDGEPVSRSRVPEGNIEAPHRVVLQGKSVDTEMLVGPVRVWTGVRGSVDWSELEGWSLESGAEP